MKKYYEAYEERYKTIHEAGESWLDKTPTPIVTESIKKYSIEKESKILEIGCGEGRDASVLLNLGYSLLATDVSKEAIRFCKELCKPHSNSFAVLDCIGGKLDLKFDFIYSVAVIHMLVPDSDRNAFFEFIYKHLKENGIALICTMGDGETEVQSDIEKAFALSERNHQTLGNIKVASTSCRTVSFKNFLLEIERNKLFAIETGITESPNNFNSLMYAIVKKADNRKEI